MYIYLKITFLVVPFRSSLLHSMSYLNYRVQKPNNLFYYMPNVIFQKFAQSLHFPKCRKFAQSGPSGPARVTANRFAEQIEEYWLAILDNISPVIFIEILFTKLGLKCD
jgi:hypothetical protein